MSGGDLERRTSSAVRSVLELENDAPDSLFEILPGGTVPFWAQVRVQIAWSLIAQENGSVEVRSTATWSRWGEARRIARGYFPSRWDAVRRARPRDVCFYVSGVTLSSQDGRARNWLVDDFAEAAGNAVVVQHRSLPSQIGRPVFQPTLSLESATARSRWKSRGKPAPASFIDSARRLLVDYARRLDQPSAAFDALLPRLLRNESLRPHMLGEVSRMLERMQPAVIVYDNGSYTYNGEFIGLMKDAGAYVVEPQHGWIGPSHIAYNYGRAFDDTTLRRALPDELFTFGTYWSNSIRFPGRVTAIGKPHLEKQAARTPEVRSKRILVVSSRTAPEQTDRFVLDLLNRVGDEWTISFRPHPGEREQLGDRYPGISSEPRIEMDVVPDVYESLMDSAVVIGEASTVLFEARAFGCAVIARDSTFAENVIGEAFGTRVSDVGETVRRLAAMNTSDVDASSTDPSIWAPGAVDTFRRRLARIREERGRA